MEGAVMRKKQSGASAAYPDYVLVSSRQPQQMILGNTIGLLVAFPGVAAQLPQSAALRAGPNRTLASFQQTIETPGGGAHGNMDEASIGTSIDSTGND